mmetsp:Transcript_53301/g.149661  ORF Transcript_53301/g.149661 Transcript_53301/m.149661 type:complete len:253 (-) Transcript_53301:369-1127(-)
MRTHTRARNERGSWVGLDLGSVSKGRPNRPPGPTQVLGTKRAPSQAPQPHGRPAGAGTTRLLDECLNIGAEGMPMSASSFPIISVTLKPPLRWSMSHRSAKPTLRPSWGIPCSSTPLADGAAVSSCAKVPLIRNPANRNSCQFRNPLLSRSACKKSSPMASSTRLCGQAGVFRHACTNSEMFNIPSLSVSNPRCNSLALVFPNSISSSRGPLPTWAMAERASSLARKDPKSSSPCFSTPSSSTSLASKIAFR